MLTEYKDPSPPSQKNISIQILRFFAALLVVFDHALYSATPFTDASLPEVSGRYGVDIFFVMSGFIMVSISVDRWQWKESSLGFIRNRLSRIVPMYWLATVSFAALIMIGGQRWSPTEWIQSLFFIPYRDQFSNIEPILSQGWTLNFEIFFYAVFALALTQPFKRGMSILFGGLVAAVVLGRLIDASTGAPISLLGDKTQALWLVPVRFWTHPIILLFLVGSAIGLLRMALEQRSIEIRIPHAEIIFVAIIAAVVAVDNLASLSWGMRTLLEWITSPLVVALAVFAKPPSKASTMKRQLSFLGDASYALYLFHFEVIVVLTAIWKRLAPQHLQIEWLIALIAITSVVVSVIVFRYVEIPITKALRRRGGGLKAKTDPVG